MSGGGQSPQSDGHLPEPADRPLGGPEAALLRVLAEGAGRVHSRRELARRIGLADRHDRRCDSLIVDLRRRLGADAILTVRSRGWMLRPESLDAARLLVPSLGDAVDGLRSRRSA